MTPPARLLLPDAAGMFVEVVIDNWAAVAQIHGLTLADVRVIALLSRSAPMSPGSMARALSLSPSGTTAGFRRLISGGFLERAGGPRNHHDVKLCLTHGTVEKLRLAPASFVEPACDRALLTPEDRRRMAAVLLDLVDALQRDTMRHRAEHEATKDDRVPVPPRWM